jgi:hypothetical protein
VGIRALKLQLKTEMMKMRWRSMFLRSCMSYSNRRRKIIKEKVGKRMMKMMRIC